MIKYLAAILSGIFLFIVFHTITAHYKTKQIMELTLELERLKTQRYIENLKYKKNCKFI